MKFISTIRSTLIMNLIVSPVSFEISDERSSNGQGCSCGEGIHGCLFSTYSPAVLEQLCCGHSLCSAALGSASQIVLRAIAFLPLEGCQRLARLAECASRHTVRSTHS